MKHIRFASLFAIVMLAVLTWFLAVPCRASDQLTPPVITLAVNPAPMLADAVILDPPEPAPVVVTLGDRTITSDSTQAIPIYAQNAVLKTFLDLAISHSWFATLLAFAAISRVWAKPLSTVVHFIVDLTPSKGDDGVLTAVIGWFVGTSPGRFTAYLIDWVTSIKIIPPKA